VDEEKIGQAIDKYSAPNGNPDINVFFKSVQKLVINELIELI